MYKTTALWRHVEYRLNSRAIFGVTHPTLLFSSNLKFSLPVSLEQCLGYLNVCKGMKSCLNESGLFRIKEAPYLSRILLSVSGSAEWVNRQHYIQQNSTTCTRTPHVIHNIGSDAGYRNVVQPRRNNGLGLTLLQSVNVPY